MLLFKESDDQLIPEMIQRFVQGKDAERRARGTGNAASVIVNVQEKSGDVLLGKGQMVGSDELLHVVSGKAEYNAKSFSLAGQTSVIPYTHPDILHLI